MKDGIAMPYTNVSTEGLHYSAAFSNGNVHAEYGTCLFPHDQQSEKGIDSKLCGNWYCKISHAKVNQAQPWNHYRSVSDQCLQKQRSRI